MNQLTLRVYRPWTARFEDVEGRKALHGERSKMLHEAAEAIPLEVLDWGETDSIYPREVVEIVIAIAAPVIAEVLAGYVRDWLKRGQAKEVEIVRPDGTTFTVKNLRKDELAALGEYIWAARARGEQ